MSLDADRDAQDDRAAERADVAHLHDLAPHQPRRQPLEHCALHGDWRPLYFGDGDCPRCLGMAVATAVRWRHTGADRS